MYLHELLYDYAKNLFPDSKDADSYRNRDARNPVFGVFDKVRHKSASTITAAGQRLEVLAISRSGIILTVLTAVDVLIRHICLFLTHFDNFHSFWLVGRERNMLGRTCVDVHATRCFW